MSVLAANRLGNAARTESSSTSKPAVHTINQSITSNQSINHNKSNPSINHIKSINQSINYIKLNQASKQSINPSITLNQINQAINQSIHPSINPSINQSHQINPAINQLHQIKSINQSIKTFMEKQARKRTFQTLFAYLMIKFLNGVKQARSGVICETH